MIESTVSQRRELDSERQTRETEEQRKAREVRGCLVFSALLLIIHFWQETVAKRDAVRTEISTVLKAFYCELCEKQFQTVAQYDEHTNSYAHHHKARFRDMQAAQKASFGGQEDLDKRREKERKREEKELRKMAKAVGIKIAKPTAPIAQPAAPAPVPVPAPADAAHPASVPKSTGFKKSGWATVGASTSSQVQPQVTPTPTAAPPSTGFSHSSWSGDEPAQPSSDWSTVSSAPAPPAPPPPPTSTTSSPAFRTGGWTSLDTGSTPVPSPVQPPQLPSTAAFSLPNISPLPPAAAPALALPPPATSFPVRAEVKQSAARQESSRSGWQQFKSGGGSSRRR
jgi:hypothetical protein